MDLTGNRAPAPLPPVADFVLMVAVADFVLMVAKSDQESMPIWILPSPSLAFHLRPPRQLILPGLRQCKTTKGVFRLEKVSKKYSVKKKHCR